MNLTPAERSALRSQAHGLSPVVMIGESGLTPAVVKEADTALKAHGLIKVRVFGDDREARVSYYETLCEQLGAAPVQHIGKLLVLYRPKVDKPKAASTARGKGLREVTIVTTHVTKRPTVKKVVLKGNERLTAGGNVRKAKTRQKSLKKNALGR
ncbi:MAG: YhbY family RNA-binding protein [Burkholderiaceae bacterium]|jgi:RNA-binding protein|nr:YhbY family RNA-binding protein [Burkholderiaceae bacterium]MBU6291815.1 YhbY family RNA-binding protein [Burkholderiales bacterium]NCV86105.1 YhbY family RNA-binding protein [Oxalobacteraceae bacterium]